MLIGLSLLLAAQAAPPTVNQPLLATFQGGQLEIRGENLGDGGGSDFLVFRSGKHRQPVSSGDPMFVSWEPTRIVVDLPDDWPSGKVRVMTANGLSREIVVELYAYKWFDIPPTVGTNALPLSLDVDGHGRVWANQEFHLEFQLLDQAKGVVEGLEIPKPPGPGPFATTIFADRRTQTSSLGEDVLIDPLGRVWFTQGGGYLYSGVHPNHSRIVCLIPDAPGGPEYRVYNVPGDQNEVFGLAWDPQRQWIWFANGGFTSGAHLVGFDPEKIAWRNHFDFSTSLWHQVCTPGNPDDACYHLYPLPNPTAQPAHLHVADDGRVWYTAYWGRAIGRLDPDSGVFTDYPVPASISKALPSYVVGAGPWEIMAAPNGDIVFNEFFDATITRFDIDLADDPVSQQLDANGLNPAMTDRVMPEYDPVNEQMHSIAYDLDGRLWYTIHTANDLGFLGSIGYLTPDWRFLTRFPPLSDFAGIGAGSAAGIAVDPVSGDMWFCEFWRKRLGRLRHVPPLP